MLAQSEPVWKHHTVLKVGKYLIFFMSNFVKNTPNYQAFFIF